MHWVWDDFDRTDDRFKHIFPRRIENDHRVNVALDGRTDAVHPLSRSLQPTRRVTAVQVKDDRSLARGGQAQLAPKRPVAGRMEVDQGRGIIGQAAQRASRLSCSPEHGHARGCMRSQQRGRPPFGWMFSQGPHDGADATGGIARPDMDHVRHTPGHAKVGHEHTDGREGLKPPGRTEVRALVGVG